MNNPANRTTPAYCLHKSSGRAYVKLNGKRHYLGVNDTPESRERYHQLVAQWEHSGRIPISAVDAAHVAHLIEHYHAWAKTYYLKHDGTPSSQITVIRPALRRLNRHHGHTPVDEFTPLNLKALRHTFITRGFARSTINKHISIIKHMFKWGVSEGMVRADTYTELLAVDGLRHGRSAASECEPVAPVPDQHIEAVLPHLSAQVCDIICLQLLTGARPGELIGLKPVDLDTSLEPWRSQIVNHKSAHRGKCRVIYFGERAQAVLRHD